MKLNLQLFAKSVDEIAKEVIQGKWGNGTARKTSLAQAGYNASEVQNVVNAMLNGSYSSSKSTASTTTSTTTPQKNTSYKYEDFKYTDPKDSDVVKQAEAMIQQHMANKPGDYSSNWQPQLQETLDKILNREKFSYDLNGDALYQQYKDQYTTQGQQAMMDTMGQAQAMTGGYGNSYAQTVGQQTYQGYLQQLNDKVPELYKLALDQYNQEGQDLYNQYGLYADIDNQEYGRYRDSVSDYYTELQMLTDKGNTAYDRELAEREFAYGQHSDKASIDYQLSQDAYNRAMSMIGMGIMPSTDKLASAGISSADAQAMVNKVKENEKKTVSSSKSSGGSSGGGGSSYNNGGYSADIVKQAQKFVGASADGAWGSNSAAKAKAKGYNSIAEVVAAMGQPQASDFSDFTPNDWYSYFSQIRISDGKDAALSEFQEFFGKDIIPFESRLHALKGANGSQGH